MATIPELTPAAAVYEKSELARTSAGPCGVSNRTPAVCLLVASLIGLGATSALPQGEESPPRWIEVGSLNRTYDQLLTEPLPISLGPLSVRLASPRHVLTVRSHRAYLGPASEAGREARLEVELEGEGQLLAEVVLAEQSTQLEDELVLPRQRLLLAGRVQVSPAEAGYRVKLLELPEHVEVRIQSQLAQHLLSLCRQSPLGPLLLDCAAVGRLLSRMRLPLPPAGTEYLLPYSWLSSAERQRLEAELGR